MAGEKVRRPREENPPTEGSAAAAARARRNREAGEYTGEGGAAARTRGPEARSIRKATRESGRPEGPPQGGAPTTVNDGMVNAERAILRAYAIHVGGVRDVQSIAGPTSDHGLGSGEGELGGVITREHASMRQSGAIYAGAGHL